jgi:hypothetical protein
VQKILLPKRKPKVPHVSLFYSSITTPFGISKTKIIPEEKVGILIKSREKSLII